MENSDIRYARRPVVVLRLPLGNLICAFHIRYCELTNTIVTCSVDASATATATAAAAAAAAAAASII